jgi:hypothetical protein
VLQARVRLAQYRELDARKQSGALRGLMWVHLRQELEPRAVDWTGCRDPFSREDEGLPEKAERPLLGFGVHREIQDALARLRTDLDSFSDAEAHALMCSAYLMTRWALAQEDSPFSQRAASSEDWRFLKVEPYLKSPEGFRAGVARALRVGEQLPFKVWRLSPWLTTLSTAAVIVLGLAVVYAATALTAQWGWIEATSKLTPSIAALGTGAIVAALAALRWIFRTYGRAGELLERGALGSLTVLLWMPMWFHRKIFDPIFLRRGKYD